MLKNIEYVTLCFRQTNLLSVYFYTILSFTFLESRDIKNPECVVSDVHRGTCN